jgi:hypothetical protein
MTGLDKGYSECLDGCGLFKAHIFYCFTDFTREVKVGKLYTSIHIATPFGVRVHKMALWGRYFYLKDTSAIFLFTLKRMGY